MAQLPVLFHGANVHTVDPHRPHATWFTTLGGRFQRVGSGPPPELSRRVDLRGQTVLPGFVDSHVHFFQTGIDLLQVDLGGSRTVAELQARLIGLAPPGRRSWVYANRYEEDALEDGGRLTRLELDKVFPNRPVWVNRVDYHSAVVNSAGLARLELPSRIAGVVTDGSGTPNGILRSEAYMHAKTRISRTYTVELKERAVRAAVDAMLPQGVTAVHALEGGPLFGDEGVQVMLKQMDRLPIDVTLFLQEKNPVFARRLGFRHMGGCLLIDGSIGSYTAALDAPYCDTDNGGCGLLYETEGTLRSFVREVHEAGAQLGFHAIGPRAIQVVLDAYANALERSPRFDHRHRIEHFELATDAQIERAADLGLVVAMQPNFEALWGGPDGMYATRLGERWRQTNRIKTVLEAGIVVAGGSDANVTAAEPLRGMHAAMHHPNPDERVTAAQALRMMTLDAAYAAFNETRHGSISPGKEASFVVVDADPLACPPAQVQDIKVLATWSKGRHAWARPEPGEARPLV
ncbi:MAG: hypothetical protein EP329_04110 [Deltaproteobacteria bacterium]|nr:MAG: hypothetical protein EP329_04110 [Deltaproteobacteria bacterium]